MGSGIQLEGAGALDSELWELVLWALVLWDLGPGAVGMELLAESKLVEVESEMEEVESEDRSWWRWNRRIGAGGGESEDRSCWR
ncbi:hypothetical protein B9Z55_028546 [Caenorhabditis nigoni]|uniref:Uncharacterized protein n=1 Tax=Caenorhabditis nigoni TaxID=1611254 RepID=A0A2G5SBB8_9PELO|nr:hypothetical protein B9Z55_028546 [Caenorhabditis nigoni]